METEGSLLSSQEPASGGTLTEYNPINNLYKSMPLLELKAQINVYIYISLNIHQTEEITHKTQLRNRNDLRYIQIMLQSCKPFRCASLIIRKIINFILYTQLYISYNQLHFFQIL
jgi:hypothetical protein